MARVTRPGGYVLALAEPDHTSRVDQPDELAALGRLQTEALRRQGADPSVGARLGDLFHRAGIRLIETGPLTHTRPGPPSPEERELEWAVLAADLAESIDPDELQRLEIGG